MNVEQKKDPIWVTVIPATLEQAWKKALVAYNCIHKKIIAIVSIDRLEIWDKKMFMHGQPILHLYA